MQEVLDILGDVVSIQNVIGEYFSTIHTFLPFISKKRLTQNMVNPLWEAGPDLALLFLCMKLITSHPQEGEASQTILYFAARRFIGHLEDSGLVSILVLQAKVLVCLYEIGHAIYPTAWISAGACARYGVMLGINGSKDFPQLVAPAVCACELSTKFILILLGHVDRTRGASQSLVVDLHPG